MKVGTLNYHNIYNYGALLQSYALKRFLTELGYAAVTVDYTPPFYNCQRKGNPYFDSFIAKYIMNHKGSPDECYDVCIYGSDTIWNNNCNYQEEPINTVYVGDNRISARRKIAYSASAVMEVFNQDSPDVFRRCLKQFSAISVREDILKDYIEPLTDKPIFHTCDPTLLFSGDSWTQIADGPLFNGPYGFIYNQQYGPAIFEIAQAMEKKTELPVYVKTGFLNSVLHNSRGNVVRGDISPGKWLSLMFYADNVLSASFHGTAFALNFRKNFFVMHRENGGSRIDSLLRIAGLSDRRINHSSKMDFAVPINWSEASLRLGNHIAQSKDYLIHALDA